MERDRDVDGADDDQVRRAPEALALLAGEEALTYGDLAGRARALALRSTSARIAEATPRPMSQGPSRTLAGLAARLSQPKRAAPWRNASAR